MLDQPLVSMKGIGPKRAELFAKLRIVSARDLLYRLPRDYLAHWTQRVDAVSAADIRAAFQRVLQPQTMVTVVVGGP